MGRAIEGDLRLGVFVACEGMRRGVASLLHDLHCEVVLGAHFSELLFEQLSAPFRLLLVEQASVEDALLLVEKAPVPVVALTPTLLASFAVLDDKRLAGVIIPPLSRGLLADMLSVVLAGRCYRPSLLQSHLQGVSLPPREQRLLQLRFAGHTLDETADMMQIDVDTALRYERRIRESLARVERSSWSFSMSFSS